jgi:hypothetical protein
MFKSPSFVDILGIALVLKQIQTYAGGTTISIDSALLDHTFTMLRALINMKEKNQLCQVDERGQFVISKMLQDNILKKLRTEYLVPSIGPEYVDFLPIVSLYQVDIDQILDYLKKAIFFYRFGAIITGPPPPFQNMLTGADATRILALDPEGMEQYTKNKTVDGWHSKLSLYTSEAAGSARGGRGRRTRVKRSNKNRRMRTRRSRTRRTTRKY